MTINQSKRTLKFCLNYSVQEKLVFESSHWNTCYKAFLNSIRWVNDSQKIAIWNFCYFSTFMFFIWWFCNVFEIAEVLRGCSAETVSSFNISLRNLWDLTRKKSIAGNGIRTLALLTWALLSLLGFASVRLITCPNCYPVPLAGASINLTGKYQLSHPVGNVLFKVHCYRNCNTSQWLKSAKLSAFH